MSYNLKTSAALISHFELLALNKTMNHHLTTFSHMILNSDGTKVSFRYVPKTIPKLITYESTIFLHVLLTLGIIYQTQLSMSTCSKHA